MSILVKYLQAGNSHKYLLPFVLCRLFPMTSHFNYTEACFLDQSSVSEVFVLMAQLAAARTHGQHVPHQHGCYH